MFKSILIASKLDKYFGLLCDCQTVFACGRKRFINGIVILFVSIHYSESEQNPKIRHCFPHDNIQRLSYAVFFKSYERFSIGNDRRKIVDQKINILFLELNFTKSFIHIILNDFNVMDVNRTKFNDKLDVEIQANDGIHSRWEKKNNFLSIIFE